MIRIVGTFLLMLFLTASAVGAVANGPTCPMKRVGTMQQMDCSDHCQDCASQKNKTGSGSHCSMEGCGVAYGSAFYAPPTIHLMQSSAISNTDFVHFHEQVHSAELVPDKHPPKFLSL